MQYYSSCVYSFLFTFIILCANGQGTDNSYTAKEKQAIQKLKKLAGTVEPSYLNEDFVLLKFLLDKKMDVNEAHTKLKEAVEWRVKNKIDKIRDEKILTELTPTRYAGHDKTGRPVVYIRPAQWDVRRVILGGQRDAIIRLYAQVVDTVMHKTLEARNSTGKDIREGVMIMDLDGYNLRQHACLTCFSTYYEWVAVWEKNYPQYLSHFFMINTPRVFTPLLQLLKGGVFSEHTNKILHVIGPDKQEWKAELLKVIDKNELIKAYGGKKD